jgi:ATP-dependent Clp protease adaptor protein ClpS
MRGYLFGEGNERLFFFFLFLLFNRVDFSLMVGSVAGFQVKNTCERKNIPTGETQEGVLVAEPKARIKRPSFYRVVLLNDDYTPMEFVVKVLENIFHKDESEALQVMLEVHQKGAGLCGVYTKDVAETKVDQTLYLSRQHEHPLQCVMEKE